MSYFLPQHIPMTVTFRGGHPENIHHGSVAVVDRAGRLLACAGDIDTPLFTRSALKPFQAMPLLALGERYALSDEDMALLCASHNGEAMHTARAASLLARAGAAEADLLCGSHVPYVYSMNQRPVPDGARFGRLHHNCSGKHSGMLLLAHALGAERSGYVHPEHPVQQAIRASVSHFSGVPPERLVQGTDGCSAPNFALPLRQLAWAFARLTEPTPDPVYGVAPWRAAQAMSRFPELVSGEGRNDLTLMQAGGGDWVSKVGADGVQAMASFSRGVAIAAKCSDGQLAPLMLGLVSVLEQLGWLDDTSRPLLQSFVPPPMRNAAGHEVGEQRAVWQLQHTAQSR
jgi:L-asparaginase II